MGWNNPNVPWSELERALSGKPPLPGRGPRPCAAGIPQLATPGSDPRSTSVRLRTPRSPGCPTRSCTATPRSASSTVPPPRSTWWPRRSGSGSTPSPSPTTTVSTASSGSPRLPPTRRCAPSTAPSCPWDLPEPQMGVADPVGDHLLVLARGQEGYNRLSVQISRAQLDGGEKGRPIYDLDALADAAQDQLVDPHRLPQGSGAPGSATAGPDAARAPRSGSLMDRFGRQQRARRAQHPTAAHR